MDGANLVGRSGADRARHRRRRDRGGDHRLDRPAGRLEDGARRQGGLRRQAGEHAGRLACLLRGVPARPRRVDR